MGKGNRVRLAKAQEVASSESVFSAKQKKKNQTPAWVGTVAIILVVVLLLGCVALSVISEGGYLLRWTKVAESEHYYVTGTMLSYYFYQNYSYFLSTYGSIASYMGLNTGASLKTQTMQSGDGTWFDYFMTSVSTEIEQMLVYCEEARARGIELDDEDYAEIDEAMKSLEQAAASSGYSVNGYITGMYGTGVKKSDIRAALEMSQLAAKVSEAVSEGFKNDVTDDEINEYFTNNPANFLTAGILTYTFSTDKPEEGATDTAEYDAKVIELNKQAEALKECKTQDDFKKFVANYVAENGFDALYAEKAEGYEASVLPDAEKLAQSKKEIIARVVENALAGKEAELTADKDTAAVVLSNVEVDLTDDVKDALDSLSNNSFAWTDDEDDAEGLWISDESRKVGDTWLFNNDSDEDATSYTVTVDMITEVMHRDETASRNVGHILFKTDDYEDAEGAKAKAEEILAQIRDGLTKESFEKAANEYTGDSSVFYYQVVPGQMVTNFNDWLFDTERQIGDVDVVETSYGAHIMYYLGEDAEWPAWKVTSRSYVAGEKLDDWFESATENYKVTVHEAKLSKINA